MMRATARIDGLSQLWATGDNLIDLEVSLGAGSKSSTCKITVSDPQSTIALALLNHALRSGGIVPLEGEKTAATNTQPPIVAPSKAKAGSGEGTVSTGAMWTPQLKAALDLIAAKEVPKPLELQGYYSNNFSGYFTDLDITTGKGYPATAGRKYNVGRYQFNRADWEYAKRHPVIGKLITGYDPLSQDLMAYWTLFYKRGNKGGGAALLAGDLDGFLKGAGLEWASIPGSLLPDRNGKKGGQVPAGYTKEIALAYYKERLVYWQAKDGKGVATPAPVKQTPAPTPTANSEPVIKGNKLYVTIDDFEYTFYHQGTKTSDNGTTEISGQGIRYTLNRRAKNRTEKSLSLKDLATRVAKSGKVALDWQSTLNPKYTHIDQTGLTDYQLLLREADSVGLMVSETPGKLVIKSRDRLSQPVYTIIKNGGRLISYVIEDKALSANSGGEMSALLTTENKSTIDMKSGAVVAQADTTRDKGKGTSGKATPKVAGTLDSGDTRSQQARTKRIAGLPSTFTVVMDSASLALKPLDTILTDGFGGVLDRIWVVDKVNHKASANTTTLNLLSPIDVIDSGSSLALPTASQPATSATAAKPTTNTGYWVYPTSGGVTSLYGMRIHPVRGTRSKHSGVDIANVRNTPIYAVQSGVVDYVGDRGRGGGLQLSIDHGNGYRTVYLHNDSVLVKVGERVAQGQQISRMGSTGVGTGVHLHFTVYHNGEQINPATIWRKMGAKGNTNSALEKVL